jgi:gliding motility-associated-like protein
MYNQLNWYYEGEPPCAEDVVGYRLYYSPTLGEAPTEIARFGSRDDSAYTHYPDQSLTGLYYITAVDSVENESAPSNRLNLDQCSHYALPNVFSPNNDGVNDIYRPSRISYVERVDMKIFNRWGILVYETEDPDINWDGKVKDTDKLVSPGVYYYICDVYEYRLTGIEVTTLTGFIYVFSGDENDPPIIETK